MVLQSKLLTGVQKDSVGYTYRHYSESPPPVLVPLNQVPIKKLKMAKQDLESAYKTLTKLVSVVSATEKHLLSARKNQKTQIPKSVRKNFIRLMKLTVKVLGFLEDVTVENVSGVISILKDHHQELNSLAHSARTGSVFGTKTNLDAVCSFIETVHAQIESVVQTVDQLAQQIKIPDIKEQKRVVEKKKIEAIFDSPRPPIGKFLETAKDRGWKVQEIQKEEEKELPEVEEGFNASCSAVTTLCKHTNFLLADFTPTGIIRFPIIATQGMSAFTESIIREIIHAKLGYEVHLVFGSYVVISNTLLVGIHKDLIPTFATKVHVGSNQNVRVLKTPKTIERNASKLKIRIDCEYFKALVPYLSREYQPYSDFLNSVGPVNPSQLVGNHYYSPLLPTTLGKTDEFSMGVWSLLTTDKKSKLSR